MVYRVCGRLEAFRFQNDAFGLGLGDRKMRDLGSCGASRCGSWCMVMSHESMLGSGMLSTAMALSLAGLLSGQRILEEVGLLDV